MSPLEVLAGLATPILLGGILYVVWGIGNGVFRWLHAIQRQLEEINMTLKLVRRGEIAAEARRLEASEVYPVCRAVQRWSPQPRVMPLHCADRCYSATNSAVCNTSNFGSVHRCCFLRVRRSSGRWLKHADDQWP
jgi:hypothetical protein